MSKSIDYPSHIISSDSEEETLEDIQKQVNEILSKYETFLKIEINDKDIDDFLAGLNKKQRFYLDSTLFSNNRVKLSEYLLQRKNGLFEAENQEFLNQIIKVADKVSKFKDKIYLPGLHNIMMFVKFHQELEKNK